MGLGDVEIVFSAKWLNRRVLQEDVNINIIDLENMGKVETYMSSALKWA